MLKTITPFALGLSLLAAAPAGVLAQQGAVAFAGDMTSIDRAVLDAAEPSAPVFATDAPLGARRAPITTIDPSQRRVAQTGFNRGVQPTTQETPSEESKSSFLGRLKPAWMFGKKADKPAATDPFVAAAGQSDIITVGAATPKRNGGVQRIPAYVPQRPSARAHAAPSRSGMNSPMVQQASITDRNTASRSAGIVTRARPTERKGLLSGLWSKGDSESAGKTKWAPPKPAAKPAPVMRPPTAPVASRAEPQSRRVASTSPAASAPQPKSAASLAPRPKTLSIGLPPSMLPESVADTAVFASDSEDPVVSTDEPVQNPYASDLDQELEAPIDDSIPAFASDETDASDLAMPGMPVVVDAPKAVQPKAESVVISDATASANKSAEVAPMVESLPVVVPPRSAAEAVAKATPMVEAPTPRAPEPVVVAEPEPTPEPLIVEIEDYSPEEETSEPTGPVIAQEQPVVELQPTTPTSELASQHMATTTDTFVESVEPAEPVAEPRVASQPSYARTYHDYSMESPATETIDAEPMERSRALLEEAYEIAATADEVEGFSSVLKRCRYVMAIDNSTEAQAYAKQLAGWALTKRGEAYEETNRLAEAAVDYNEALRSDPDCWRAEHALGVMAARRGDADTAQRCFNRTISLNPEFAKAYSNRAALAVQRGDYYAALRDYQLAIEINPDLEPAHTGRGRVCHMLGMLDQGLRHLDAAELLSPEDGSIATGRGDLLTDLGRYGHALEAYRKAISLEPEWAAAYRNLAWLQATCPVEDYRDGESALANVERAEQLSGVTDDLTLDTKAAALATLGRYEEAAELVRKAIELAPGSEGSVYRERLALYEKGEAFVSQPIGVRQATYTR